MVEEVGSRGWCKIGKSSQGLVLLGWGGCVCQRTSNPGYLVTKPQEAGAWGGLVKHGL